MSARHASDLRWYQGEEQRNKERFNALIAPMLKPGMRILDVGAGRDPTIPAALRPPGTRYVGMDEDAGELARAADCYDEVIVSDVTLHDPRLDGQFDVIVSWQVFEHVRRPRDAYANIQRYLKPGGWYGGRLTGRYALFAIVNRMLPIGVTRWLLARLSGRTPGSVFRAYYQDATLERLRAIFGAWSRYEIWLEYDGREYFHFSRVGWAMYRQYLRLTSRFPQLASYYTILAWK